MKKLFTAFMAMASLGVMASSTVPSQEISGEGIWCISPNGVWMVSEMSAQNCMAIRNLETGEVWGFIQDGTDFGDRWDLPLTRGAANDGTIVGEYNNIPSYWNPTTKKWTNLKGYHRDAYGNIVAVVGGITPDGSMIVGSLGQGKGMFDDAQMSYPCIWYRQADGTYGDPVWLPNPGKDYFGMDPQYVNATSVSDDGKTIGISMRSGQGFHHFPFVARQGDDGEWTVKMLGESLINPRGMTIPEYPGEYWGPDMPNIENYMSAAELAAFYAAGPAWIDSLYEQGIYDEETITYLELEWAMNFMSDEEKARYEPVLREFLDKFPAWQKAYHEWEDFLLEFDRYNMDFMYNRITLSPDGKYLYAVGNYSPVRFDLETEEATRYSGSGTVSCVTDDYSVLVMTSVDGIAYIYPQNSTRAVSFLDYWKGDPKIYGWMEEHMYREVVTGVTSTGAYQISDKWCMGRPVATPDMSLFGFACSSEYWYPEPADGSFISTFLINPEMPESNGVECIADVTDSKVTNLGEGRIQFAGEFTSVEVYDLSGMKVFGSRNPEGIVSTGLSSGVYIVRATTSAGKVITNKVMF